MALFLRADGIISHEAHTVLGVFQHLLETHSDGLNVLIVLCRQLVSDPVVVELEVAGIHPVFPIRG